ncbi:MAG: hypothetical protein HYY18_14545 [Planctomycetes bacterium]|nr:hypothetical protein [Planctomycetota bacterium]
MHYDFGVAWNWEHDEDLVADLGRACAARGIRFHSVTESGLGASLEAAARGELGWSVLLDRAWESDPRFQELNTVAASEGTRILNPPDRASAMGNKAAIHAALAGAGVSVPQQIDFMPSEWNAILYESHAEAWRRPLWLKPASRGGGDGVVPLPRLPDRFPLGADWQGERFILQEGIPPMRLAGRAAYFRVFTVLGRVFPLWWDPATHRFAPLSAADEREYELECVAHRALEVGQVCGMDLFSTEISVPSPGVASVIDPVNDPVDLRRQSRTADGVPDAILSMIVDSLAEGVGGIIRTHRMLES